jgi:sialate O-acetylesterase
MPAIIFGVVNMLLLGSALADVRLPAIFSDHMVLKKSAKVPIWGSADPGEVVTVTLNGRSARGTTADNGKWTVTLDLSDSAQGPFEMTVEGKNKLTIKDVVVGEVWVASGQSNMEWALGSTSGAAEEISASENPLLRQFLVKKKTSSEPLNDVEGSWVAASPATSGGFSAVGYYFARRLQRELQVPVGLIHTSWGATPSEAWTSVAAIDSVPELRERREQLWAEQRDYPAKKAEFVNEMDSWVKETGRTDKPTGDVSAFAGLEASTEGWTPITLPGAVHAHIDEHGAVDITGRDGQLAADDVVLAAGLPEAGIVWVRKDVELTPERAKVNNNLRIPLDGFDSVYWNGELLKQTTYQEFPGTGFARSGGPFDIPFAKQNVGKNVLAIRLYQPVGPAKFTGPITVGPLNVSGEWLAKAEEVFPALAPEITAAGPVPPPYPQEPKSVAAYLFNGMVAPFVPYAISGVIWYQGESNVGRAWQYRTAFPLLIKDWRQQWGQGDFPFYFCQLANFQAKKQEPGESPWAELRETQSSTLLLPNTGQAVLIDVGESMDIHPGNKKDPGERLAAIALARDYGKSTPFSGPVYDSVQFKNGKATLRFKHTDGGLVARALPPTFDVEVKTGTTAPLVRNSPGSDLEGFAVCGEDKNWVWADARIEKDQVVVWSDKVPSPIAVRYAWAGNPACNLYNGAGFPASPFRTDDFAASTFNAKY